MSGFEGLKQIVLKKARAAMSVFAGVQHRGDPQKCKHMITIEFCKGWGYHGYAWSIADRIEQKYPNTFLTEVKRDNIISGKIDVFLYPSFEINKETGTPTPVGQGIKVHSKELGRAFEDWPSFDERVKNAVEEIKRMSQKWRFLAQMKFRTNKSKK